MTAKRFAFESSAALLLAGMFALAAPVLVPRVPFYIPPGSPSILFGLVAVMLFAGRLGGSLLALHIGSMAFEWLLGFALLRLGLWFLDVDAPWVSLFWPVALLITGAYCFREMWAVLNGEPVAASTHKFGSARWANRADLERFGFLNGHGLILWFALVWDEVRRELTSEAIRFDAGKAESLLTVGVPGSGKFTTVIAPAMLDDEPVSYAVYDPKQEIYAVTAAWRQQMGQEVRRLIPFGNGETDHYNPMDILEAESPSLATDAGKLADAVILPDGDKRYFTDGAKGLVGGVMCYLVVTPGETRTLERSSFFSCGRRWPKARTRPRGISGPGSVRSPTKACAAWWILPGRN